MKGLGRLVALAGVLLFIYSIVGRFVGGPTIGFGIISASPIAGMVAANGLMLIGVVIIQLGE